MLPTTGPPPWCSCIMCHHRAPPQLLCGELRNALNPLTMTGACLGAGDWMPAREPWRCLTGWLLRNQMVHESRCQAVAGLLVACCWPRQPPRPWLASAVVPGPRRPRAAASSEWCRAALLGCAAAPGKLLLDCTHSCSFGAYPWKLDLSSLALMLALNCWALIACKLAWQGNAPDGLRSQLRLRVMPEEPHMSPNLCEWTGRGLLADGAHLRAPEHLSCRGDCSVAYLT